MPVSVGTFNLNNLFSRFNFNAQANSLPDSGGGLTLEFHDKDEYTVRTFMGNLVKGKDPRDTQKIADRIKTINADVLAVQEVEHIEILKSFNRAFLGALYPHVVLVEGNDTRLIDVAVLSKFPLGAITSYQAVVHPDDPSERVFGRDLLRVEILNTSRNTKLFTLYCTHLKSHFVPRSEDQVAGSEKANLRRQRQAEMIAKIISDAERPTSRYILAGDMNDPPDSPFLKPMLSIDGKPLTNALANPEESRPAKAERTGHGPQTPAWTYRHPVRGQGPEFSLYDQIWLSSKLGDTVVSAGIDRRTTHGGDGSDHDPAWVVLDV